MDRKFTAADKRNKEARKQVDEMVACAASECRAYADSLDKAMLRNFEVPGHVNKTDFITDEEAAAAGQFFHLGSWLKSNEEMLRALVDELDEKIYKLTKKDELILSEVAANAENAKTMKKLLQKTDKELKWNKQDADKKREKLNKHIDNNKEQLNSAVKQLQQIINRNQKEAHQMST